MPAVVAIESNPEALIFPFTKIKAGTEVLIGPSERTDFVDQSLLDRGLQLKRVEARRGLLTEDLLSSNLGAFPESVLEVKGEKGGKAPRREDFETSDTGNEEYIKAYTEYLRTIKGMDPQTISRVRRGLREPWTWKRGHPGDRE